MIGDQVICPSRNLPPPFGNPKSMQVSLHFPTQSAAIWTVARKLEIDLPAAIKAGDLTPEDLSGMLRDCAHCWHKRKCAHWQRNDSAREMAGFCPSAETVNDLVRPQRPLGRPHLRAIRPDA